MKRRHTVTAILLVGSLLLPPPVVFAGEKLVLENDSTRSFSARTIVIDKNNAAGNLTLTFGKNLNERLFWDNTASEFALTDDLDVQGTMSGAAVHAGGGNVTISMDGTSIFNVNGNAVNFRVATDNQTNMFFIDGTNDRIGIQTGSPETALEIVGTASGEHLHFNRLLTGSGHVRIQNVTDSTTGFQLLDADGGNPVFNIDTTNERIGIGSSSPTTKLEVIGTASGLVVHAQDLLTSSGNIIAAGDITLNSDNGAADAILTFGNDAAAETLRFSDSTNGFIFSDDVEVQGTLSGATVHSQNLLTSSGGLSVDGVSTLQGNIDTTGNIQMTDKKWIGLSDNAGRIDFKLNGSGASPIASVLDANLGIRNPFAAHALDVSGNIRTGNDILQTTGGTFAAEVQYTAGTGAYDAAMGDVNNDGYIDLIAPNADSNTVSVLLNDGDGTFAGAVNYTTATDPRDAAVGDVNNDGYADIAVTNLDSDSVSVFINDGDGTFAAKVDYAAGTRPIAVEITDVNNDGYADLVTGDLGTGDASVFINDGDGTFAARVTYATGDLQGIAVGDLNNDGYTDIAGANDSNNAAAVFLNDGDGTFGTAVNYAGPGSTPRDIALGDLNNDGYADLVMTEANGAEIGVFINDGDGTFAAEVSYSTAVNVFTVALGDVNNDGYADIAVDDGDGLSVFINDGDGTFAAKVSYAATGNPHGVFIGDLDNDGYADIAAGDRSSSVSVFINQDSTQFIVDKSTNRVGVGTATPETVLEVVGTASGTVLHAQDLLTSSGNILAAANITLNSDNAAADAILTFGNDAAAETLRFSDSTNDFIFSDDLEVQGTLSGAVLHTPTIYDVSTHELVLAMNFNSGSVIGSTVLDSSEKNNHGTNNSATYTATGGFANLNSGAFDFSGSDDYISIPTAASIDLSADFTWVYWAKFNDLSQGGSGAEEVLIWETTGYFSGVRENVDVFTFGRRGVAHDVTGSVSVTENRWYHVAVTVDGSGNVIQYINGEQDTTGTTTLTDPSGDLHISDPSFDLNGTVDDVRVYARVFSAEEVQRLYLQRAELHDPYVFQKDVFVDSAGNIGIGTTAPETTLEVVGTASGRHLHAQDLLTSSGNIIAAGDITLNSDNGAADAILTFGNDALAETLRFSDTNNLFEFSDDVHVTGNLTASGKLVIGSVSRIKANMDVSGTLSGAQIHVARAFSGAGLVDCDTDSTSKLLWDSTTEQFSCGTDQDSGGGSTTLQDAYTNDADGDDAIINLDSADDSVVISNPDGGTDSKFSFIVDQNARTGSGILIDSEAYTGALLALDNFMQGRLAYKTPHIMFGYSGTFDTSLYRQTGSLLRTDDSLWVGDTLSGATLYDSRSVQTGSVLVSRQATAPVWQVHTGSLLWYIDGPLVTGTSQGQIVTMPFAMTVKSLDLRMKNAPGGAAMIVDINEAGTTIFSTRPEVDAGVTVEDGNHAFSDTSLAEGSEITIDIDQVGSGSSGSGLTIMLHGLRQ